MKKEELIKLIDTVHEAVHLSSFGPLYTIDPKNIDRKIYNSIGLQVATTIIPAMINGIEVAGDKSKLPHLLGTEKEQLGTSKDDSKC